MTRDPGFKFSDATKVKVKFKKGSVTIKESLSEAKKFDLYELNLTGRSSVRCLLDGLSDNVELALYDSNRRRIAISKDRGATSHEVRSALTQGTYFVGVKRLGAETDYRLKLFNSEDPGDDFKGAVKLPPGQLRKPQGVIYRDSVGRGRYADPFDFYQFTVTEENTYSIILDGLKTNADIELYDSRQKLIVVSEQPGIQAELIQQVLTKGVYYIKVNATGATTKYDLRCIQGVFDDDNSIDSPKPIPTTVGNKAFNDSVGGADQQDLYRIDLFSPSNINLVLNGLDADANLQLLGNDGKTVIASSVNPGRAEDVINQNLKAGSYFLKVFPANPEISTKYTLNFSTSRLEFYGLAGNNNLVAFNLNQPNKAIPLGVTGLAAGEMLRGIDFRPLNGELYGLSNTNQVYQIDLTTGAATAVNATPFSPALTGTSVGFDFNPVSDRLRVVSEADENLRLLPTTGTVVDTDPLNPGIQADGALVYDGADLNAAVNPNITATAYSNNVLGAALTTLYGIDSNLNTLVRQGSLDGIPVSPNEGKLVTVGALGADFANVGGFDISSQNGVNTAYATSGSTLYAINLSTGAATSLTTVSIDGVATNLVGLAVRI
jgi:hypothetical protein